MEQKLAQTISYIFHPVLMSFYAIAYLLSIDVFFINGMPLYGKTMLLLLALLTTVVLPLFLMLIYKRLGWISDFHLHDSKERKLPLLTMGFSLLAMGIMLQQLQIPAVFNLFYLAAAILTVILMVINNFWKVSLHTSAIGGTTGAFFALALQTGVDFLYPLMVLVLLGGIVAYARLKLKSHNEAQVYSGFIVGFIMVFSPLYFL
ncbi:MAG: hypothetical protein ACOCQ6_01135 [Bacteroidota bacterium]